MNSHSTRRPTVDSALDPLVRSLADHRRRVILRQLRTASSPVEFSTLVDAVLDAGDGDGDGDGDDRTRQRVAIALDHRHLPKLAAQDFVAYDRDRGRVTYTAGSRAERLLDALSRLE